MLKKLAGIIISVFALSMMISYVPSVKAAEIVHSGKSGDLDWSIDSEGCLRITGKGDYALDYENEWPAWCEWKDEIKSGIVNVSGITSTHSMFEYCSNLQSLNVSNFDTSQVTDMGRMFASCERLKSLAVSNFDTSQVTDMYAMFSYCNSLESLDMSNFDTSQVAYMSQMFYHCINLKSLAVSNFDTSQVTDMYAMFSYCSSLERLDVSNFDTSQVMSMEGMFGGCSSLESLDISNFDTSEVFIMEHMEGMFDECSKLHTIKTPKITGSVTCDLPSDQDNNPWTDNSGNVYTTLPINMDHSIVLTRKVSGGGNTGDDTSSSFNTSTNGVCTDEAISKLIESKDFKTYFGESCSNLKSIAMIIPGLEQTNMGDDNPCHNMVPQGICATNDYILISAYCHDLAKNSDYSEGKEVRHRSVIYVMDKETKKYISTIVLSVEDDAGLKRGNHVGGLAFGNNTVYIAGSGDNKVWKLAYDEIVKAATPGSDGKIKDAHPVVISKNACINTINASFIYWDDYFEELFVGNFDSENEADNYMCSYDVDTGKSTSSKIVLRKQTQGVTFWYDGKNRYCICSASYGRKNKSTIYVASLKKDDDKKDYILTDWHKVVAPNMSEDIQTWASSTIYQCFESAAKYYNSDGMNATAFDRIPYFNARSLVSSIIKDGNKVGKKATEVQTYSITENNELEDSSIVSEGICGEQANYCLYDNGELFLSGQGNMYDYSETTTPWNDFKDNITSIYIDSGVTSIGDFAFYGCSNLTSVSVSEYMNPNVDFRIGTQAFGNCALLEEISLPNISYSIGENAFDSTSDILFKSNSGDVKEYCDNNTNTTLHQHDVSYVKTVDATCLENGYDLYQCECGYEKVSNVIEATGEHSYVETERSEATEEEEGYIIYECENCVETYVETLEYGETTPSTGDNSQTSNTSKSVKVSNLSISGISKKIAAGKKVKLTANIAPSNATNKAVTWKSSNTKVAAVSQSGVVTMKKKSGGKSVTITATAADGSGRKATYKIKSMKGVVKKVSISGKKSVKAGKSLKLKAKVKATKKANSKLKWTSSNPEYAKVSGSGKVKTYKAGKGKSVKITAMATDGSGKKKSVKIKIK